MGLTKNEGRRVYQYEAFMIVLSGLILGTIVGVLTSLLISGQFAMFVEMPMNFHFPFATFSGMVIMASVTTWFAVYTPVKLVNKKQIAAVLKGGC